MQIPFVDLKAQYQSIKSEIDEALRRIIDNTAFIGGSEVSLFEQQFAAYTGTKHCIGLNSGTTALHFAIRALRIGPGDEVIIPVNTFAATAAGVIHAGATPVFVDHDPQTYLIDLAAIERAITPRTKAIVPVHLYGQPADLKGLQKLAEKYKLIIIEDCAQSHGALDHGVKAGSVGALACYSFYPGKNLGAYGDAGGVTTNNEQLARTVRLLHDHGSPQKYHHEIVGYNDRLDGIQAAVLNAKLPHLDKWTDARNKHAKQYKALLGNVSGIDLPGERTGVRHVYHLFVIRVPDRNEFQSFMNDSGIATQIHYPIPLHLTEAFRSERFPKGSFPVAESYADHLVSLPMYPELTEDQISYIAEKITMYTKR